MNKIVSSAESTVTLEYGAPKRYTAARVLAWIKARRS